MSTCPGATRPGPIALGQLSLGQLPWDLGFLCCGMGYPWDCGPWDKGILLLWIDFLLFLFCRFTFGPRVLAVFFISRSWFLFPFLLADFTPLSDLHVSVVSTSRQTAGYGRFI